MSVLVFCLPLSAPRNLKRGWRKYFKPITANGCKLAAVAELKIQSFGLFFRWIEFQMTELNISRNCASLLLTAVNTIQLLRFTLRSAVLPNIYWKVKGCQCTSLKRRFQPMVGHPNVLAWPAVNCHTNSERNPVKSLRSVLIWSDYRPSSTGSPLPNCFFSVNIKVMWKKLRSWLNQNYLEKSSSVYCR